MSDDERDIDIESDEGDDFLDPEPRSSNSRQGGNQYMNQNLQAEKRAHHNALERKRRDHIKDSFSSLRDSVPALQGEKASRAQILKKAADYIQFMRRKNSAHQQDIDDLKRQNSKLESQIDSHTQTLSTRSKTADLPQSLVQSLEKAKATGNFAVAAASEASSHLNSNSIHNNSKTDSGSTYSRESESDLSDSGSSSSSRRSKKQKTSFLS